MTGSRQGLPERRGRGARLRRAAAIAALAAALGLLLAVAARNRIAELLLPRLLGPALRQTISVESVSISLRGDVALIGLAGSEPEDGAPVRRLRAAAVRARVALPGLLSDPIGSIESVSVEGGDVEIDLDRGGEAPERGSRARPFPWPERPPELKALATVVLVSREARLELRDLHVAASGDGEIAARATASWRLSGRSGEGAASLGCRYAAGAFTGAFVRYGGAPLVDAAAFDAMTLEGEAAVAVASGTARVAVRDAGHGVARVSVHARGIRLGDAVAIALRRESPVSGDADLEAEASIPLRTPLDARAEIRGQVGGGSAFGVPFEIREVAVSLGGGEAVVSRLDAVAAGAAVEVVALRAPLAGVAGDPASLFAAATGRARVRTSDAARSAELAAVPVPGEVVGLLAGASVDADLAIAGGAVLVRSLAAASGGGDVALEIDGATLRPRFDAPLASSLFAVGRFSCGDAGLAARFLPEAARPGGVLTVDFAASGTAESPRVRAAVRGHALTAFGAAPARVDGLFEWGRSFAHVARFEAASEEGLARVSGAAGGTGSDAALEGVSIELDSATLGSRLGLPFAAFRLRVRAEGPLAWPDFRATLAAEGFATAFVTKGGDWIEARVPSLTAAGFALGLAAEGSLARDLRSGELAVSRFTAVGAGAAWELDGTSNVAFDAERSLLLVDPPLALRSGPDSIEVAAAARDDGVSLRAAIRHSGGGGLPELLGRAVPEAGPDFGWRGLRVDAVAEAGEPLAAIVLGRTPPARIFATFAADAVEAGGASAAVSAVFRLDSAASGSVRSTFDAAVRGFRSPLVAAGFEPGNASVNLSWDGSAIAVEGGAADWAGFAGTFSGTGRFTLAEAEALLRGRRAEGPDRLDLRLDGRVDDVSAFRRLSPALRRLSGAAAVSLRLEGRAAEPRLGGAIELNGLDVRLGDLPPLVAVEGRLRLDGDALFVDALKGELGGASFSVGGGVSSLFGEPRFDLLLTGEDLLLVRTDEARIRGTPRLSVAGPLAALEVAGELRITDGRVRRDVPLLDVGGLFRKSVRRARSIADPASARAAGGVRLFSVHDPPLRGARFDVKVTSDEPIGLLGNVFSGKLRPDVRLRGTGEVPFLTGVVYVEDFLLRLPASRIRVESGLLRFDEKNPFLPEIEMTGSTRMRGYDIDVSISGPYDDPLLVLSSNPPMASDQLMVLVATGRTPADEASRTDTAVLVGVASYLGGDILESLFGGGGVDDGGESLLDRFELDVGRNVSSAGQETIEARFRLKRGLLEPGDALYLTGERDEFEHYNAGLRIVFRGK